MNYEIILARPFKRSVKKLKKRFPSVNKDIKIAVEVLLVNPKLGVLIPGSSGVRKLRVLNSDLHKGKRNSYRLLYYIQEMKANRIYLLLLYAKSDRDDVTLLEIQKLLEELNREDGSFSDI